MTVIRECEFEVCDLVTICNADNPYHNVGDVELVWGVNKENKTLICPDASGGSVTYNFEDVKLYEVEKTLLEKIQGLPTIDNVNDNTIYDLVKKLEIEYSNYCSDLYLYVTVETMALIDKYKYKNSVTIFTSCTDGKRMYDIPFGYNDYNRGSK